MEINSINIYRYITYHEVVVQSVTRRYIFDNVLNCFVDYKLQPMALVDELLEAHPNLELNVWYIISETDHPLAFHINNRTHQDKIKYDNMIHQYLTHS